MNFTEILGFFSGSKLLTQNNFREKKIKTNCYQSCVANSFNIW